MKRNKPLFDDEAQSWESLYSGASTARWGLLQGYARRRVRARLELCFSLLPPLAGGEVIELGCGPGYYGSRLLREGARWTGVDVSEKMLLRCRARTGSGRLARADVRALPFSSNCSDAVLCIGVLSYLRRREIAALFSQVRRILRPGGILLAQTVRFDPVTWIRCRLPRRVPRPLRIPGPFYPRSPGTITRLLARNGLALERIAPYRKYLLYPAGTVYLARKAGLNGGVANFAEQKDAHAPRQEAVPARPRLPTACRQAGTGREVRSGTQAWSPAQTFYER